jgi:periplasmic copper chaperone A
MSRAQLARRVLITGLFALPLSVGIAYGHTYKADGLKVDHPYATPTAAGEKNSAVYLRALDNGGKNTDELIGARVEIAERVEIRRTQPGASVSQALVVREVSLPSGKGPSFRHNATNGYHLLLVNLKAPLKNGDRFPLWLQFRHAGEKKVMVWVQTPRGSQSHQHDHKH